MDNRSCLHYHSYVFCLVLFLIAKVIRDVNSDPFFYCFGGSYEKPFFSKKSNCDEWLVVW